MDQDLLDFLKGRGIGIEIFKEEKIDCNILLMMEEDALKSFLPAYGDRLATVAFCRAKTQTTSTGNTSFVSAVHSLRTKWKTGTGHRNSFKQGNSCAKKITRRVELGWMDFDILTQTYKQVRQKSGGGVRHLAVEKNLKLEGLLEFAKEAFFPSQKGQVEDFDIELRDFQGMGIDMLTTVTDLYEKSKLKLLRAYMYTIKKCDKEATQARNAEPQATASTQTVMETDPAITVEPHATASAQIGTCLQCHRTLTEDTCLVCHQNKRRQEPLINDKEKNHQILEQRQTNYRLKEIEEEPTRLQCSSFDPPITESEDSFEDADTPTISFRRRRRLNAANKTATTSAHKDDETSEDEPEDISGSTRIEDSPKTSLKKPRPIYFKRSLSLSNQTRKPSELCSIDVEKVDDPEDGDLQEAIRASLKDDLLLKEINRILFDNGTFQKCVKKLEKKDFQFGAKCVVWSVLHGGPGFPFLNQNVLKQLCDEDVTYTEHDVKDFETKEILSKLREATTLPPDLSDWLIDKGIQPTFGAFGEDEKQSLINLVIKYSCLYRTHAELTQFKEGLKMNNFLQSFTLHDLEGVLCQSPKTLTLTEVKTMMKINFSPQGSNDRKSEEDTIYAFEIYLQDCLEKELDVEFGDLLTFWTGSESIPPGGFDKQMEINFVPACNRLPVAHTCEMSLELPRGLSPEELQKKLTIAIQWGGEFHLV